jgi:DNA-binding MarR family transcriptional regulator
VESPTAASELAACACLQLRKVTRKVTQIYEQALEPLGLGASQFGVLAHLFARPGFTIGGLAAAMMMDATTLTRVLRPLDRGGLVTLVTTPADRRRREVALTDRGKEVLREALPLWREAQAQMTERLGPAQMDDLRRSLGGALTKLAEP